MVEVLVDTVAFKLRCFNPFYAAERIRLTASCPRDFPLLKRAFALESEPALVRAATERLRSTFRIATNWMSSV